MKDVVLIPAYQPDERLITLVEELTEAGLGVLVVDDGSGPVYSHIFNRLGGQVKLLSYRNNQGKGAALKRGMRLLTKEFPEAEYFITADADGQHRAADILRVRDELHRGAGFVLTMRKFQRDMPLRSRIGNDLSRVIYTLLTGHFFRDNQSGLRGFSVEQIPWLLQVKGEKYDYEMNTLYFADKQHLSITTIPIDAIYIDGNRSSHFDPIRDTLRIYRRLFGSAVGSIACILLVELLVLLTTIFAGYEYLHYTIPACGALGLVLHLLIDRFLVFRYVHYRDSMRLFVQTLIRFAIYLVCCKLLSFMLPWLNLWLSFNLVALLYLPVEYWTRKLVYISQYRDFTRET